MSEQPLDFRSRVRNGEHLVGIFIKTPAEQPIEILGGLGFDFVVIDAEHAPFDRVTIDRAMLAAKAAGIAALVRLHSGSGPDILSTLDSGAHGILVPHVTSADRARDIVSACRYKGGRRGFSNSPRAGHYGRRGLTEHIEFSDRNVTVVMQIEDPEALDEIDAIASVDGVDALFVGRGDLAVAMGASSVETPEVIDATRRIAAAAKGAGKALSVFSAQTADGSAMAQLGATLFVAGSDQFYMTQAAREALAGFRELGSTALKRSAN
ncbi:5-keto-4-deoxy-D-glucarate aldolase [Paraburkholderia domus]|uniref:HpcH/HpaI aldolase family protein n=1 Tax=Paraburkholderia domus TaxID=2793075 RepID=UPI0019115132|nr:aldolase/citrate lyase family protein [Paraburkholderia domus]MBK5091725.1 aldolase [Burkholderia sp. R-69927]CAE6941295.1 5-keto-4-deoxy-D-glucarate aldolase [Paraburkholderia domus]